MENWEVFIKKLIELIGFKDFKIEIDYEHRHGSVFIFDDPNLVKENLPTIIESINHLVQLIAKKNDQPFLFLDVNNYRRERENLIVELVRATARKVMATQEEIPLPAMNSYERRLAHVELSTHPGVTTESIGKGHARYVIVKPIKEEIEKPLEEKTAETKQDQKDKE